MKINEIEISGFKGIPHLVIHPKQINILVGKNNTGKTSILEAISSTLESDILGMRITSNTHPSSFINVNKKESKVVVKLDNENRYLLLRKPELTEIIPEFKKQIMDKLKVISRIARSTNHEIKWKEVEEILDKLLGNEELLHKIENQSIRVESGNEKSYIFPFTHSILKELEPLVQYINKNILQMSMSPILHLLEQPRYFDFSYEKKERPLAFIRDLTIKGTPSLTLNKSKINEIDNYLKYRKILENLERFDIDKLLFKHNEKEYEIPFSFMGDGFKSLIGLIAQISKETKIVLLEEPENHMHPAYTQEMIQQIIGFSIEKDIQFFITTHNSDILDVVSMDVLKPSDQEYLSRELNIIRLDCLGNNIMVQELNRKEALEELEDLKIDLRGR